MKILHVIPSLSPVRGGPSRAVIDMVRALIRCGVDVEIATTNDDGDNLLDVTLGRQVCYNEIPTYFFSRFSPAIPAVREFTYSGGFTKWLFQHITDYDLVHVHALFSYTSTVAMAIARLKGVPYLTTAHGLLCRWSLQQGASKKQAYLQLVERGNLDRAQLVHLTSDRERDDFLALNFKVPALVLPLALSQIPAPRENAAALLRQKLNFPQDEPIILFLSRLHYVKGLDYLIPALGKLTDRQFTFVLAGSGSPEYEAEIHSLLRANGLEDRTRVVGFVSGEDKDLLIQGCDLFALTSHLESFGLAVLEALAVGTPVLVTTGVGLASLVRDKNLGYVTDLNVEAIAGALDLYLADPDRAKVMGTRALHYIREHYTWDKIAIDLVHVYKSIVDRQPLPFM